MSKIAVSEEEPFACRECSVREDGFCGALAAEPLRALSPHTHITHHEAGAELFGDETELVSYANVVSGVIKLMKVLEDGRQQVVGLKFAGDFIGRLHSTSHSLTAEAASPVTLCQIPRGVLEAMLAESRALEQHVARQTLRELDEAREWMVTLGRKSAAERVATFLYLVALRVHPDLARAPTRIEFDLPLTRSDIADFLGLSIETVSRQLTALRTAEVVIIQNKRHMIVPDTERLRLRAGWTAARPV